MATGSVRGSYFNALSTTEEPSAPIADADCASCPAGHGIRAPMTGKRVSADSSASRDLFSVHLCFMVCGLNVKHDLGVSSVLHLVHLAAYLQVELFGGTICRATENPCIGWK